MLFKSTFISLVVAAAAVATPASLMGRQGAPEPEPRFANAANCTFGVRASGVPASVEGGLENEWNYLLLHKLYQSLPSPVPSAAGVDIPANAVVNAPTSADGTYTITYSYIESYLAIDGITQLVEGWVGKTVNGPWSTVDWTFESIQCIEGAPYPLQITSCTSSRPGAEGSPYFPVPDLPVA